MRSNRKISDQVALEVTSSFNQSITSNQTKVDNLTNCDQVDTSAYPFFITAYSLVFLVGFLLNGFIIKFYFCRAKRQSSSSIMVYLKNLAAADLLLGLCLPMRISNYTSSSTTIQLVYCNFGASALFLNLYASILFMGYIAANRYLKIVQPSGTHTMQTVRTAHIISGLTWGFLLAITSAYVIVSFQTQEPLSSGRVSCVSHSGQFSLLFKIVHTCCTAIFLSVLVAMVFFYYSASRRVTLAQQSQPASFNSDKLRKSHRKMFVLVAVFCFCYIPYHLVRLPRAFLGRHSCSWKKVLAYLMELTVVVSVLNICLDPLIYFIFCKAFRTQLIRRVKSRN